MVDDYSDLLHDRKISTWLYENRVKKMIQALAPAADAVTPMPSPSPTAPVPTAAVAPTATALPGPTLGDINALQDKLKDLDQRFADLQVKYDQRLQDEDSNDQLLKSKDQERQDEMKLVKNLMDTYESNLQKVNERLDQVSDKANQKTMTDEELEQELTILHKDLRDNTQDLTILKQQVSQLDAPQKVQQDPLDDFLTSKWLAGGALLVGLAALTVGLTKK
jgi:Fe2+ transport system protein B